MSELYEIHSVKSIYIFEVKVAGLGYILSADKYLILELKTETCIIFPDDYKELYYDGGIFDTKLMPPKIFIINESQKTKVRHIINKIEKMYRLYMHIKDVDYQGFDDDYFHKRINVYYNRVQMFKQYFYANSDTIDTIFSSITTNQKTIEEIQSNLKVIIEEVQRGIVKCLDRV